MAIGITSQIPTDPFSDLGRRITDLERLVRELAASRSLENSTIGQNGIQIVNGGSVKVIDTDLHVVAQIGALPSPAFDRADGPQPGLVFYREDGTLALLLGDRNAATPPFKQAFQVVDRAGGVVVADDTNSGHGLANPHLPAFTLQDTNVTTWPATTSNVYTNICDAYYEVQNPYLQWSITLEADAGTTGQFKLLADGIQLGTTQVLAGGAGGNFAYWQPVGVALYPTSPVGTIAHIELDAARTAGTGSVRAICRWMTGTQSP